MVLQQLDSAFPSVVADGDIYKHWDFLDYVVSFSTLGLFYVIIRTDKAATMVG